MRSGRVPWRGVAREGCALLEVALPVLADRWLGPRARRRVMDRVVIGMDPHKASVTIEARDSREVLRARGRFGTDKRNYALMLRTVRQWPNRLWAVEGANGIGRPIAQRLLADSERVLDVPARVGSASTNEVIHGSERRYTRCAPTSSRIQRTVRVRVSLIPARGSAPARAATGPPPRPAPCARCARTPRARRQRRRPPG